MFGRVGIHARAIGKIQVYSNAKPKFFNCYCSVVVCTMYINQDVWKFIVTFTGRDLRYSKVKNLFSDLAGDVVMTSSCNFQGTIEC